VPAVIVPPAGGYPIGSPVTDPLSASRCSVFLGDAIDPDTLDYRSVQRGTDPLEARLLEKLLVQRASGSAVMDHGQKFREIRQVDDKTESLIKSEVLFAWQDEIANREIEVARCAVTTDSDTAILDLAFTRLSTGETVPLKIPLLSLWGSLQ